MNYKEFRIGSLFKKVKAPFLGKGVKAEHVSKQKSGEYCVPIVYAKSGNNGIMYWAKKGDFTTYENVISIIYNGAIAAGLVYAQEEPTGVLAESYMIKLKDREVSHLTNLYLKTAIQKVIYPKYSREYLATWNNKVENDMITLPTSDGVNPDYDYMESEIAKIQNGTILQLEKFLLNEGLKKCELLENDIEILTRKVNYKEYCIGDLFEKLKASYKGKGRRQDNVSKVQTEEFSLPLINCKDGNNGIMYYGREKDFDYYTNVLSVIYNGPPTVGKVYVQEKIGVYTDAYLVALKKEIMPEMSLDLCFYLKTVLEKAIHNTKYSRANKATWDKKVENDYIYLPTSDGINPDYEYMENYIIAQKKLAIKETVEYINTFS